MNESFDFLLDLWQTVMDENGGRQFYNEPLQRVWKDAIRTNEGNFSKDAVQQLSFEKRRELVGQALK
jgi:hypothetical protein